MAKSLVQHFFHFSPEEIDELPITKFGMYAEQAINIGGFLASGKLEYQDSKAKKDLLRAQYEELIKRGLLHGGKK